MLLKSRKAQNAQGEGIAKANVSAAETASGEDSWFSRENEIGRRPQSARGAPQEGTSSPHAGVTAGH
jgi:hypothetical protein